MPVPTWETARR